MIAIDRALRIRAIFLVHALGSGGLYARVATIQRDLAVDETTLGLAFLGMPVGAMLMQLFGSRLVETLGTRRVLARSLPVLPVATALLAAMPSAPLLFAFFIAYGALYALPNMAMNIEADRIEAAEHRRVMNSCHGVWSAGYLVATLLGTLAEAIDLPPAMHMGLLAIPLVPLALWATVGLTPAPARPHAQRTAQRLALPTAAIMLLVLFTLGPSLLEGALRNWSVIYMGASFSAPSWVDTLSLPVFLAAHALGRLSADRLVTRHGVVPVARTMTAAALVGTVAVVVAPDIWVALLGFLLIGVGVCVAYPLTTSAAARIGDRPATQNVASLTFATQIILLGSPAVLGLVAGSWGLRAVFAVLLPMVALSLWLARHLEREGKTA